MRTVRFILVVIMALALGACGEPAKVESPVEALKEYTEAAKNKDLTKMKLLLSEATLKLHTDQAKAQKVTLDEIIQRETFFPPDQRVFAYRNEKVEGDKATVDVKNNFGGWDQIFLVRENGGWKIDKKGTAQQIIQQSDKDMQKLDDEIDSGRIDLDDLEKTDGADSPALKPATPLSGADQQDKGLLDPTIDQPGSPPVSSPTRQP